MKKGFKLLFLGLLFYFGFSVAKMVKVAQANQVEMCCPPGYGIGEEYCPINYQGDQCCRHPFPDRFPSYYIYQDQRPCEDLEAIVPELTVGKLRSLNPLFFLAAHPDLHHYRNQSQLNVAGTINRLLSFLFPIAGLILFVMLVWGGFEMLTGAASKKNLDAGKQRITAAITGFILLFVSYWLTQIIEYITGVKIL